MSMSSAHIYFLEEKEEEEEQKKRNKSRGEKMDISLSDVMGTRRWWNMFLMQEKCSREKWKDEGIRIRWESGREK